jgi:hypothetical protein
LLDPNQIKSAIGNEGTYDMSNPDMGKKRGGYVSFQSGGPVELQDGGRVGKTRAAAEKLLRVLHGSPTRITPEQGKAIDVTTEPSYAVKRGTDKMLGKSGPPMVNQFDVPAGKIL